MFVFARACVLLRGFAYLSVLFFSFLFFLLVFCGFVRIINDFQREPIKEKRLSLAVRRKNF